MTNANKAETPREAKAPKFGNSRKFGDSTGPRNVGSWASAIPEIAPGIQDCTRWKLEAYRITRCRNPSCPLGEPINPVTRRLPRFVWASDSEILEGRMRRAAATLAAWSAPFVRACARIAAA